MAQQTWYTSCRTTYDLTTYEVTILVNQEILSKCQMWVKMQPSAQSSFHKFNVDNSCQKTRKIRYYIIEVLNHFTVFLQFVQNILARIVDKISVNHTLDEEKTKSSLLTPKKCNDFLTYRSSCSFIQTCFIQTDFLR